MGIFPKLVIISGLSGSGKSSALNALEDLDYYAVDNLPMLLFDKFSELLNRQGEQYSRVALVMDLRDQQFADNYPVTFRKALAKFPQSEIIFLEASDDVLIRRFSETRRKHPLSSVSVAEGIAQERRLLTDLKHLATTIIDTSSMDVHGLKKRIVEQFGTKGSQQMQVRVVSFGYKYGVPKNCDLLFDVRFLSNPHFIPELKDSTGLDKEVQDFISKDKRLTKFLDLTTDYLKFVVPEFSQEGKSYLSIGVGCTGGKHRSVYIAEILAERLKKHFAAQIPVSVEHQDLRLTAS